MHKLYYVKYTLIYGKEQEDIADRYLFTENDVHPDTYNCETFWDLFGVIRELKDLYSYTSCFSTTQEQHTHFLAKLKVHTSQSMGCIPTGILTKKTSKRLFK